MRGRTRDQNRTKAAGNLLHVSSYRALNNITPSVEAQLVEKRAKCCLSVWSYFADVMLTYEIEIAPRDKYSRSRRAWERGYVMSASW